MNTNHDRLGRFASKGIAKDIKEGGKATFFKDHIIISKKGAFGGRVTNLYGPKGKYLGPFGNVELAKIHITKYHMPKK